MPKYPIKLNPGGERASMLRFPTFRKPCVPTDKFALGVSLEE